MIMERLHKAPTFPHWDKNILNIIKSPNYNGIHAYDYSSNKFDCVNG